MLQIDIHNDFENEKRRMVRTIAAQNVTLYDLEQQFSLQHTKDQSFFLEWQAGLPELTEAEQQRLIRVQDVVANLERRSVLENTADRVTTDS